MVTDLLSIDYIIKMKYQQIEEDDSKEEEIWSTWSYFHRNHLQTIPWSLAM